MPDISQIDKNFSIPTSIDTSKLDLYPVTDAPFSIHGLILPQNSDDRFRRMPANIARTVNDGVFALHTNTAGGRVRFKTDSERIAIFASMGQVGKMSHTALTGTGGFDLYCDDQFTGLFAPPVNYDTGFSYVCATRRPDMKEVTINFPLYSEVRSLTVGLDRGSRLEAADPYRIPCPIVYYGSSITQGACASRPGSAYQAIISRRFGCDFINLGFSGSARGEDAIADYIAGLSMSVFVYDYDHNSPTVEHLQSTHERMFLRIRERHPDLPIVMISRPQCPLSEEGYLRRDIIQTTYRNALGRGDNKVRFINGEEFFARNRGNCETVDGCHPNDLGFMCMAQRIGDVIEDLLK